MDKHDYDAIVVGSGPNGLAAAIALQQEGLAVLLVEAKATIGGGMRTAELTLPGFRHDIGAAILPLAVGSPFFNTLPLSAHGLEFVYPEIAAAHPFDDGSAAILTKSVEQTAQSLGADEQAYLDLMQPIVEYWPEIVKDILAPLHFPKHALDMARFGLSALTSAQYLSGKFTTKQAKGLWAGMAAHAIQPLSNIATSAFALVLMTAAHHNEWPAAKGGSQSVADALAAYFTSIGGKIQTSFYVSSLKQLPSSHAVLFDVTPKQLLAIAGEKLSSLYRSQLTRYRYGPGIFKVDWALSGPIPFTSDQCRRAGTVHLGNTIEEIADHEQKIWKGLHGETPFVLLTQQSIFDPSRAPAGKHTGWAYCHVPAGSQVDMTDVIETQVERFAPGFRECILEKHTFNTAQLEDYNSNCIGGDINGGVIDIGQLFTRPALRLSPYRTSAKGLYLCSSSTPPGGGVHGMCGYHAAKRVLKDVFNIKVKPI